MFQTIAEEAPEEVKEEPPVVEEIAQVAKDVEPSEEKPSSMSQVMNVLCNTNFNNIIPTNKQEGNFVESLLIFIPSA